MATSLRTLIEGKFDSAHQTLTLDATAFGKQVTSLLAQLNVETLALTSVTLDPAPGTTPTPVTSTVSGTTTLWGVANTSLRLAISGDGDSDTANVTLTASIASITLKALADAVLPISGGGLDHISVSQGTVTAVVPAKTLVFRATVANGWAPFGLQSVHLETIAFAFAGIDDPDDGMAYKVMCTADLVAGSTRIPIEIDVPLGAGAWTVGIVPPGVTVHALTDIAALFGGAAAADSIPPQLAAMTTLHLKGLQILFDPAGPTWSGIDFDIATGQPWPIADHIQIDEVGLRLSVRPKAKPMVNGAAYGQFSLDPLTFQATIPIPLHGTLHLGGRTNEPLPGFGALARLVDAPFADSLPAGIANLGSLQINRISLDYDLDAKRVSALGFEIASGGPWTLIPKYLSLDQLQFGVDATRLSGGWGIQGVASGTVVVATIRVAAAVEGSKESWTVSLTEPLRLPSIGELAALVGGDDSASVLPEHFGDGIGALTISRYEMVFGGPSNQLQTLALDFATSQPWKFWDPYFVLQSLDVHLAVSAPVDGARKLDAAIHGVIEIGSVFIALSATHPASGTGWTFSGGLAPSQELAVKDFTDYLTSRFHVDVPDAVKSIVITALQATFVTDTRKFTFHAAAEFTIADTPVAMTLDFTVTRGTGTPFELNVVGDLVIGTAHFVITFDKTKGESRLTAVWDQSNKPIGFGDIARTFGFTPPDIPEQLDLTLTGAGFSYDFTSGQLLLDAQSQHYGRLLFVTDKVAGTRIYLLNFEVPLNLHLSDLPVAGEHVPEDIDVGIRGLGVSYASADIGTDEISTINTAAEAINALPVTPTSLDTGMTFSAVVQLGTSTGTLVLPLSSSKPAPQALPAARLTAADVEDTAEPPATPTKYDAGAKWITVGKTFGPVQLERVGVGYESGTLSVLFDASLTLSALSFALQGAGLGSPLTHFSPRGRLDGMAVSFSSGPLEIAGGILRVTDLPAHVDYEYIGAITIAAEPWMIQGVASFARVSGEASFFLFAQLSGELGGPPFFFITGFMGGFGYNSRLRLPEPDQVSKFPFVAGLDDPAIFGKNPTPMSAMTVLAGTTDKPGWVTPSVGDNWIAAGILFRSCGLVAGRALIVVEFGHGFEIALLGLGRMSLPQGSGTDGYAYVELQLEVVFRPEEGYFGLIASLTPASFLLSNACHLTGGFAFCLWFGPNKHAGDFVISIGGYHPAFTKPDWYPALSPVGFNWIVGSTVTIKGGAYFALTPGAVMAGGSLEVVFQTSVIRAWFIAYANLLIGWKPFHFRADIGISVGAAIKVDLLFTTTTLSFELGASLDLWGPPTGGVVHVHLWILSFSVRFGSQSASDGPPPLKWGGFEGLLPQRSTPAPAPHAAALAAAAATTDTPAVPLVLSAQIARGLSRQDDAGTWFVRGDELIFTAFTAVPATDVQFTHGTPVLASGAQALKPPAAIDIRPMGLSGVTSPLTIAVTNLTDNTPVALDAWSQVPQASSLPEAMWGAPLPANTTPPPTAKTIGGLPVGARLIAPPATTGRTPGPMEIGGLVDPLGTGWQPLTPASQSDPTPRAVADPTSIGTIGTTLASPAAVKAQTDLVAALRALDAAPPTSTPLARLAANAGASFTQPPLKVA